MKNLQRRMAFTRDINKSMFIAFLNPITVFALNDYMNYTCTIRGILRFGSPMFCRFLDVFFRFNDPLKPYGSSGISAFMNKNQRYFDCLSIVLE